MAKTKAIITKDIHNALIVLIDERRVIEAFNKRTQGVTVCNKLEATIKDRFVIINSAKIKLRLTDVP